MTMADWRKQIAKSHSETEFEKYRIVQDRLFMSDYDRYIEQLLTLPENRGSHLPEH